MSEYMSTDNIGATLPLSSSGAYNFPLVVHDSGRKEGSEVSRHVRQHSGAVFSLIYDQAPPDIIYAPRTTAETVPDPNDKASHGCQSSHPYLSTPYNGPPRQSVAIDSLLEFQRSGLPRPDASQDDGSLLSGSQDRHPALCLVNDALSSTNSSLAPVVGSPPLSKSSAPASIPQGCQFSAPPAFSPVSNSPVPNTVPSLRSHQDQQHQEAWMRAFASVVTPVWTDGYRDKNVEAIIPYNPQGSSCQISMSYEPRRILHPGSVPQPYFDTSQTSLSSRSPPVYASDFLAAHSPSQETPQHQSRAENTKKQREKKYWCPGCRSGFSQSQVLGRHIKDKHETKQTCPICVSFTWSRGRPYLYREHLQMRHHLAVPPEVRQKGSRHAKEKLKPLVPSAKYAKSANYMPALTRDAPLHNTSFFPRAKQ
ncbi:hypothetical protein EDB89DRAFT_1234179 [Lactarius sanguifluus]|nr:hypothetical protein EDB89DRAFT_1234179 [Lactarius sanguifluus]